jgi:hypothetical protein
MLGSALLLALAVSARAESVDDIVTLAQKGVGEDVILATVDNAKGTFQLSAADIIKLKDSKVPEKVITAMLRHKSAAAPAPAVVAPAPAIAAPAPAVAAPAAPVTIAAAEGILNIENLDDRVWSYKYDPDSRTIWFTGPAADGRGNLESHGGLSVRMPPGTYKVRYSNQENGPVITVFAGDKSLIMLSRVDTNELEALYATVFERGERKATGKLVALRGEKKSVENTIAPVQERVVERVVETPPTVIYRETPAPVYSYPAYPYSYGYYSYPYSYGYPRCYGPSSSFRFGYSNHGHHSGIGVGFGF